MATIKVAKNLILDDNGYTNGVLTVIETTKRIESNSGNKRSLMKDYSEVNCFELVIECKATNNEIMPIKTAIFGTTINPEPVEIKRIGSKNIPIYNKFTTVLLRLNILNKDELDKARKDVNVIDTDTVKSLFLAIKDLPVKFKPQKNEKGFIEPNLLTLEITGNMPSEIVTE